MNYTYLVSLYILLCALFVCGSLKALNPYRLSWELRLQEPSSGPYTKEDAAPVQELWLTQNLDHFEAGDNRTWQMRYFRNAKYHEPQGPMYIFLGGEWTITPGLLSTGLTHDMAVENAGILFYTEHRYYGQSWPFENNNLTVKNLKYLSLHQALADVAHFIRYQKAQSADLTHSKVILIGGSYSGSMAAWMTHLYPELVTAVWASSAPLLAKADFYEYMQRVENTLTQSYGSNCTRRLERGLEHLVDLFNGNKTRDLLRRLNVCPNFNASDSLDRIAFFSGINNYFAWITQSYSTYLPQLCETLLSQHSSDAESLLTFLELLYTLDQRWNAYYCQDFSYNSMLQLYNESSDHSSGSRAWFYQTCSQFGWFTTTGSGAINTTSGHSTFGSEVSLWYFEQLCRDAFGPEQSPATLALGIAQMNSEFGGHDFDQSLRYRHVLFTHGELDPWRVLGCEQGRQALVIPGYSHVEDLASINVQDSVPMNLAKLRVMSFLRRHTEVI
ncbi:putative serine protease K12H4.7 [Drosophila navojoa]|nr:putative serine protease K12H4.7 [Drosophila navojoa]